MFCPICNQDLDVNGFGICRARKTGRNLYCRSCIREKSSQSRARLEEMEAARKEGRPAAPLPLADSVVFGTALTRVRMAVRNGAHTREEIESVTGLSMDEVCDALAKLSPELRFKRVDDEAYFYPLKVA